MPEANSGGASGGGGKRSGSDDRITTTDNNAYNNALLNLNTDNSTRHHDLSNDDNDIDETVFSTNLTISTGSGGGKLSPVPRSMSRSPRPYRRTQTPQDDPKPPGIRRWSLDEVRAEGSAEGGSSAGGAGGLLLTAGGEAYPPGPSSRSESPTSLSPAQSQYYGSQSVRWAFRNQGSGSGGGGSESGTEADDELPKKLPAPPRRNGKGLRGAAEEDLVDDEEDEEGAEGSGSVDGRVRRGKMRQGSPKAKIGGRLAGGGGSGGLDGVSGGLVGVRQGEEDLGASVKKRRKNIAFVRRAVEISLIAGLMGVVLMGRRRSAPVVGSDGVAVGVVDKRIWREVMGRWRTEAAAWVLAYMGVLLAYPFAIILRKVMTVVSTQSNNHSLISIDSDTEQINIRKYIQLPRSIDPAPLLYPVFFPLAVSLLISPDVVLQNMILALSSLPPKLFPHFYFQWGVALLPLLAQAAFPSLGTVPPERGAAEVLSYLPALHIYLTNVLAWTLQPSLTMTEIRLLSTGLVNLLVSATTPQAVVLKALLWIGGFGVLFFCSDLIMWGVQLARIPRHRFRRAGEVVRDVGRFGKAIAGSGGRRHRGGKYAGYASSSASGGEEFLDGGSKFPHRPELPHGGGEGGEDGGAGGYFSSKRGKKNLDALAAAAGRSGAVSTRGGTIEFKIIDGGKNRFPVSIVLSPAATSATPGNGSQSSLPLVVASSSSAQQAVPAKNQVGSIHSPSPPPPSVQACTGGRRKRAMSTSMSWYTSLTHSQARTRKYLYAAAVYVVMILLVFVGIRPYLTTAAFGGTDPFPWAASYLFCGVPGYSNLTATLSGVFGHPYTPGEGWTGCGVWHNAMWSATSTLPSTGTANSTLSAASASPAEATTEANRRLFITFYWLLILLTGLLTIHLLSPHRFEVDTRRKLFHGMVVLMFLLVGVVDPWFTHLAMSLVLSLFMIADLIRAGQLPPVSRPLSEYLAPFVDGRDLKGPVVVSHFFLLVGGAVGGWFTVAKAAGAVVGGGGAGGGGGMLEGLRRTEFVAGVVCVGLGDSAASLVGRRWGTWKWGWVGGKSVQGSLAFMGAVSAGLGVARWWLGVLEGRSGGGGGGGGGGAGGMGLAAAAVRVMGAAGGAAMLEAVVTGGNDNVVVPIALWCCVSALGL